MQAEPFDIIESPSVATLVDLVMDNIFLRWRITEEIFRLSRRKLDNPQAAYDF